MRKFSMIFKKEEGYLTFIMVLYNMAN